MRRDGMRRATPLSMGANEYHHHKLAAYGSLMGAFCVAAASTLFLANPQRSGRRRSRPGVDWGDLVLLGVATHKVTRIIAKDRVTQPIRAPFTRAEQGHRVPEGGALRTGIGELVTCPYCLAPWTGLTWLGAFLVSPKRTRLAATLFAIASVSDFANRVYARLED